MEGAEGQTPPEGEWAQCVWGLAGLGGTLDLIQNVSTCGVRGRQAPSMIRVHLN